MNFTIIGTGNTAWFLGKRLVAAGNICNGVWGRNATKAGELAEILHTKIFPGLATIPDDGSCCIIAISDHAIAEIAADLSFSKTVLCHTAGTVSIDVLKNAAIHTGVIWPVYSILKQDIPTHRNIPFVWEANSAEATESIKSIIAGITDISQQLDSEKRKWLHLGAVLGNNFTNHILSLSEELCRQQQIPFQILHPILSQTFERVLTQSPKVLQTGPARRNDTTTMGEHLHMLQAQPLLQAVYKTLSASIENMYNPDSEEKGAKR